MFLTNNDTTICNLMMYSKGVYVYKIPKADRYAINSKFYWTQIFQNNWGWITKHKKGNKKIDFTKRPYGNIKEELCLRTTKEKKIILCYWKNGEECF